MNENTQRTETLYIVLEDGTILSTRWKKEPGDKHIKADRTVGRIKYCLTREEYNKCLENRNHLVREFSLAKAEIVRAGQGWSQEKKMEILKAMYEKKSNEPLMTETFFISMGHLI